MLHRGDGVIRPGLRNGDDAPQIVISRRRIQQRPASTRLGRHRELQIRNDRRLNAAEAGDPNPARRQLEPQLQIVFRRTCQLEAVKPVLVVLRAHDPSHELLASGGQRRRAAPGAGGIQDPHDLPGHQPRQRLAEGHHLPLPGQRLQLPATGLGGVGLVADLRRPRNLQFPPTGLIHNGGISPGPLHRVKRVNLVAAGHHADT